MSSIDLASRSIRRMQADLIDLHDPQGIYFHRACNACLATLMAAAAQVFWPTIAQPLLVIAALCFVLSTNTRDRRGRPITLLGSLLIVLLSTGLLVLTQVYPILQALVLISLGFLIHYLTQFGAVFSGGLFVWVLSLLASAGNPSIEKLPDTLLNITLGWLIVYFCYFWILPYRPYPVLLSLLKRTRLRLATRLQQIVDRLYPTEENWDTANEMRIDDLDQRLDSLISAQQSLLRVVERKQRIPKNTIVHYRKVITTYEELFEAILVLEQSLRILRSADPALQLSDGWQKAEGRGQKAGLVASEVGVNQDQLPSQLQSGLQQLSQQAFEVLEQSASSLLDSPLQLDPTFEQWLQVFVSDFQAIWETHIQHQNTQQAIYTLVTKVNAVVTLPIDLLRTTDVP